jgi:hypothetical protein
MTGLTVEQIIASVGPPSSRSSIASGQQLYQWQATGCHVALLFDGNGRFIRVNHEYAQYAPPLPFSVLNIFLGVIVGLALLVVIAGAVAFIFLR